jgi:hypothetical protein
MRDDGFELLRQFAAHSHPALGGTFRQGLQQVGDAMRCFEQHLGAAIGQRGGERYAPFATFGRHESIEDKPGAQRVACAHSAASALLAPGSGTTR